MLCKNKISLLCLIVTTVFLTSGASCPHKPFPSNKALFKSNVALNVKGYKFESGLSLNSAGKYTGDGLAVTQAEWVGSGFLVDEKGTLVTNWHVAKHATSIEAVFKNGGRYTVSHFIDANPKKDLAVLKLSGSDFTSVKLGNSNKLQARDDVLAIGNAAGLGLNIGEGKITQVLRNSKEVDFIRHNASMTRGNSGGALYKGRYVVGVNQQTLLGTDFHGAVPVSYVQKLLAKNNSSVDLKQAFSLDLKTLEKKLHLLTSATGDVKKAKDDGKPTAWYADWIFEPLTDYLIIIQSQHIRDLVLQVENPFSSSSKDIVRGLSDRADGPYKMLLLSQDSLGAERLSLYVWNYGAENRNFSMSVHKINWQG